VASETSECPAIIQGESVAKRATPVPKKVLVDLILHTFSPASARKQLSIRPDTDLKRRLEDFTKAELLRVLQSTREGEKSLEEAEKDYPLHTSPTLYLVTIQARPDLGEIVQKTEVLSQGGCEAALDLGDKGAVRRVYCLSPAYELGHLAGFLEVPVVYERKIEYTEVDPKADDFGERKVLYSLERAFIWLPSGHKHGLIASGDFVAVRPILQYGRTCLRLRWAPPNLTEEMLHRLSVGAIPRSATFSSFDPENAHLFDVKTVTLYDPSLSERRSFAAIVDDDERTQTAGFFGTHPDLPIGGLGIAKRYGRIWTPARLDRNALAALATALIKKTEKALENEYAEDMGGFIQYYRNVEVSVEGKQVRGALRDVFDQLVQAILEADRNDRNEREISEHLLASLVRDYEKLRLSVALEIDCPNCGNVLVRCPECFMPLGPTRGRLGSPFGCEHHQDCLAPVDGQVKCICQAEVELVDAANHLVLMPHPELLQAIRDLIGHMQGVSFDGRFIVHGKILRVLPKAVPALEDAYSLAHLELWRIRARYHMRSVPGGARRKTALARLALIKEKCRRADGHPTKETCRACLDERLTIKRIEEGDVCLPRLFGEAIDQEFDGVHHAHEVADVRYQDRISEVGKPVRVGIHLKSRVKHRKHGLGRNVYAIKGLYTQLCYSAYLASTGGVKLDVVGVSIPNAIKDDVCRSMKMMANEMGVAFIMVSEEDWLRIHDAVLEKIAVEQ